MRFALGFVFLVATAIVAGSAQPNVILLLSDDQGYGDMGCHGHPLLKTPHMDRLYKESVRMTDFSVSPTCAPTRAALMTGMQEFNSGVTHTLMPRRLMNRGVATLPQLLREAGYATGLFGKWHLGQDEGYRPDQRGFDVGLTVPGDNQRSHYNPELLRNGERVETEGYRTDIFYEAAMEWIEEQGDDPFFCYLPTYNAHGPLIAPEKYVAPYRGKAEDEKLANFFGMLANLDENIGRLMDRLEALGIAENTVVIFINDNGGTAGIDTYNAGMRGCKGTIWRGGTRAFAFWRWPGHWEARDEEVLSGHVDVLPTLVELAGGTAPEGLEGISLAGRLKDAEAEWPDDRMIFQHVSRWSDGFADAHRHVNGSTRWKSWHLMRCGTVEGCEGECRVYRKGIKGERMLYTKHPEVHYKQSGGEGWELYDLAADPGEERNVAAAHPEVVQRMEKAYEDWWEKVRPLLVNEKQDSQPPKK